MINVGVVGYGYWGPNLVRNFSDNPGTNVFAVCDLSEERLSRAHASYPNIHATKDLDYLLSEPMIDAIVIATPVKSHYSIALASLQKGKHVFVEKPICSSTEEAKHLVDEADKRGLVLMVDHTFIYTGAVRKIKELVVTPEFGKLHYYDSTRVNLGLFQHDVNVLWDLAVHDLSIMSYVLGENPVAVSATGHSLNKRDQEYCAFLTLYYDNQIAHINVNWLSPVKVRKTLICGSGQMIVYDDLEQFEKVKVYDRGVDFTESDDVRKLLVSYRTGDMWSPKIDNSEALGVEVEDFRACIDHGRVPLTGGKEGIAIVRILEAANLSLSNCGAPIEIK